MMTLVVGFTGTRAGMTPAQKATVQRLLEEVSGGFWAVHGDCVGADAEFHGLCMSLRGAVSNGAPRANCYGITVRPATTEHLRAFCKADITWPPRAPLDRNDDIVRECHVLIAAPKEYPEITQSGTWATVRRARKIYRPCTIVLPNGNREEILYP